MNKKQLEYAKRIKAAHDDVNNQPEMDKDNPMMQPIENWERKDRLGLYGRAFFLLPGSRRYQKGYENIDWSK